MREEPVPDGAWAELVRRLKTALKPPASGMFAVAENAPVQGTFRGNELCLTVYADFAESLLKRPNVLQTVAECASAQMGRPIQVKLMRPGQERQNGENFERLLSRSAEHPDIFEVK